MTFLAAENGTFSAVPKTRVLATVIKVGCAAPTATRQTPFMSFIVDVAAT